MENTAKASFLYIIYLLFWGLLLPEDVCGSDWPMFRCGPGRTAVCSEQLPGELHLQWKRQLAQPAPAWPKEQYKLQFDRSYEPVVGGKTMFIASTASDSVTAYDTDTGAEKWRVYCDGPVRFAPLVYKNKVIFASDDGYLYCLDAANGKLIYKFRAAPSDRKILGNARLINTWPVRGGPVLYDGKVYFAAGIWPFMGTFIYALEAETGKIIWTNSGTGSDYTLQPHSSPAFAGVAPQGYIAASEDIILIPGGRSVPAAYDRKTGRLLYFEHNSRKKDGGCAVMISGDYFYNSVNATSWVKGLVHRVSDGKPIYWSSATVFDKDLLYTALPGRLALHQIPASSEEKKLIERYDSEIGSTIDKVYLKAGSRVYAGDNGGTVIAIDADKPKVSWRGKVDGGVWNMLAADGKLFVSTLKGDIYCFGSGKATPKNYPRPGWPLEPASPVMQTKVQQMLEKITDNRGYCLLYGADDGVLLKELIRQSQLHIVAFDTDPARVSALRRDLDAHGLYGKRVAIHNYDVFAANLPPYIADLIVVDSFKGIDLAKKSSFAGEIFNSLRPYGGTAVLYPDDKSQQIAFMKQVETADLPNSELDSSDKQLLLRRPGSLPGSASWTHQYSDAAHSVFSEDKLVKGPLGLLWFGDRSEFTDVLPRHGHGPSEHVVGGRLFIEGIDCISARDVYTGRILWKRVIKELDTFDAYYDKNYKPDPRNAGQRHIPGANEVGSNFVSMADGIYVMLHDYCLVLSPVTGETIKTLTFIPPRQGVSPISWGSIAIHDDLLIATAMPIDIPFQNIRGKEHKPEELPPFGKDDNITGFPDTAPGVKINSNFASGSGLLVVMNRHTGKILWSRQADHNFRHNAIAAAAGYIFCVDKFSDRKLAYLNRKGAFPTRQPALYGLNARTGEVLWKTHENIFGTWLAYSKEHDILIQAGSNGGDRADDETREGMNAYRGSDGTLLWAIPDFYFGPPMLVGDKIITQAHSTNTQVGIFAAAYDLFTGKQVIRTHPITGKELSWRWMRLKGCNTATASENLLLFRSSTAAFVDLTTGQGTATIGGFKSGCTSSLVAADGVLNAPDYTRTCTCSFQNQSSLALVHAPEVEYWSYDYYPSPSEPVPVKRVGINFGAPGNRFGPDGTLWLEFPSIGGLSPDVPVKITGGNKRWFRKHSSLVKGDLNWVTASGIEGPKEISIRMFLQPGENKPVVDAYKNRPGHSPVWQQANISGSFEQPRQYTVRLYFAEPDKNVGPGRRVFDVFLQDKLVLENFDITSIAGGASLSTMKEFKNILVEDDLKISFSPDQSKKALPVICGVEIIAENW